MAHERHDAAMAERSPAYADDALRAISTSPHVPVQLPGVSRSKGGNYTVA